MRATSANSSIVFCRWQNYGRIARSSPNEPPQPGIDAFNEAGQPIGYCGKRKDDEADYNQRAALPPVRHGEYPADNGYYKQDRRD